jgi:hypothetical protein
MPSGTSRRYDEICADYGLIASRNNPGEAHAECRAFVDQLAAWRDRRRREAAVRAETVLRPLPTRRTTELHQIVRYHGTPRAGTAVHSGPA